MPTIDRQRFADLVRDALAHLYDFAYLRTHPLLALIPENGQTTLDRVLRLRQHLQQGIERLAPAAEVPAAAKEWRPYLALRYHYVDCLELPQVEKRLGLGDRQLLRERNRGLEALADLLWDELAAGADRSELTEKQDGSVSSELSALGLEYAPISLRTLIERARQSVHMLSAQHNVDIVCTATPGDSALADETLLRQTLITGLSHAVMTSTPGKMEVRAGLQDHNIRIQIIWTPAVSLDETALAAIAALVQAQKGTVQVENKDGRVTLTLLIPQGRLTSVLLIEDNVSLQRLYARYLAPEQYRVLLAETSTEGLRLAAAEKPDVIVLDVMMRGMDGWEVLQRLRAQPETQSIPVIISSVLPEKDLALSLGADAFLPKPVSRFALLDAIQAVLHRSHNGD